MGPIASEFRKWQGWIERIKADVQNRLVHPRQIFRVFAQICQANAKHIDANEGGDFCHFVQQGYVAQTAVAIRSHVKHGNESISLVGLLVQIRNLANQFTFPFYLEQFPIDPTYVDWQSGTFSLFSEDGKTVSPEIVRKDIDCLKSLTTQVEKMADRTFAHLDKRGFDGSVTFNDLNTCVDKFDELVCKYLTLIKGSGYATLEPTILFDWEKVFTVPLDIRATEMP